MIKTIDSFVVTDCDGEVVCIIPIKEFEKSTIIQNGFKVFICENEPDFLDINGKVCYLGADGLAVKGVVIN